MAQAVGDGSLEALRSATPAELFAASAAAATPASQLIVDGALLERQPVEVFRQGEHHGKGTITYYDKSKEIGEWKDGEFIVLQKIKAPVKKKSKTAEDAETFGSWEAEQENLYQQDSFFPENNYTEEKQ